MKYYLLIGRTSLAIALFLTIVLSAAFAQTGIIKGTIKDAETAETLAGATVKIEARQTGAVANPHGVFVLRGVPAGAYTLLTTSIGYEARKIAISVQSNDTTFVTITLKSQLLKTNDVVVSAGKRVQAVQDVPVSITTVGQRELQQRGITRLDDALRYVPGVNMNRDQVNIRGSSGFSLGFGSRVGVFLDGFPLLSGDGGDAKFDALPMFNVERIEVVKGAGSALYGTGALGGIINVITAQPTETPEFRFRGFAGAFTKPRYEEWRWRETLPFLGGADASYSQKIGDVGVLIAGGYKRSEGHQAYYENAQWNGLAKLSYEASQNTSLNFLFNYAAEDRSNWVYWKSLSAATLPPDGTNREERFKSYKTTAALDVRHIFSDGFFMTARAGVFATDFKTVTPTQANNTNITSAANSWNGEAQFTSIVDSTLLFTYGATATLNAIVESPIIDPSVGKITQRIVAAYVQGEYKPLAGMTITLGSRFDGEKTSNLASSGVIVNPKFGISYQLSEETQLRASAGAGFRAPTIAERFAALRYASFTVQPNPTLRNERSWSFEIGGKQAFKLFGEDWNVDGALFWSEYDDLVEPRLPSPSNPQIQFVNITRARIQGVEVALNGWLPGKTLGIETSITAINPRDLNLDQVLKYRSTVLWYSRLILPIGAFQIQADYRFQSRFEQIDDLTAIITNADARVPIHILDVRVIANMAQIAGLPMLLTLNVRNALDYYYNEIIGNLAPTRHITLQVDMKF